MKISRKLLLSFGIWLLSTVHCSLFTVICPLSTCQAHGDHVSHGAQYKEVTLDDDAVKAIGIKTEEIEEKTVDKVVRTTGQIEEILDNKFTVNCPVKGRVVRVLAGLGDRVKSGQPLARIRSTEVAVLQSELSQQQAEFNLATSNYEREKKLFDQGISAKKDYLASEADFKKAKARLEESKSKLRILTDLIGGSEGSFDIKAKKSGTIVDKDITVGEVVNPDQILFKGVDISKVWASADIYEKDISSIKIGQDVYVTLDGLQDKVFEGKLDYIGSVVDEEARTLPVSTTLINTNEVLKPGAYIQLAIHSSEKKKSIVIPRASLVDLEKEDVAGKKHEHIVYVNEEKTFVPRKVEVESHDSNLIEIISGLMSGELVVTKGAYQLKYGKSEATHDEASQGVLPIWAIVLMAMFILTIVLLFLKRKSTS